MASTSNHRHGHIIPPQLLCDILAWSCRTQEKDKRCDPGLLLFLMMFNTSVCCLVLQITCRMLVNSPCYICMIYIKGAATCTIAPVCRAGHSRSRRPCFWLLCDTDLGKFVALQKRWMSVPLPPTKVHLCVRWRKKNDFGVLNCISNPGQVIILFWAVGLYWDRTSEWGSESQTAKRERGTNESKGATCWNQTWATSKDIVSADGTRAAPGEPSGCLGYSHTMHNSIFDKSILFCTWLLFC